MKLQRYNTFFEIKPSPLSGITKKKSKLKKVDKSDKKFENIYKILSELKSETELIEDATAKAKLNNKINELDQEVVELENQVLTIKAIVET